MSTLIPHAAPLHHRRKLRVAGFLVSQFERELLYYGLFQSAEGERMRTRALPPVLLLMVSLATSLGAQSKKAEPISPAITTARTPQRLFQELSRSVFVVEALDSDGDVVAFGSGVAIGTDSVLTNHHVIEGAVSIRVTQKAKSWSAMVIASDADRDLCRLRVHGLNAAPVPVRPSSELAVGEKVYAIGTPEGLELTFSEGVISGLRGSGASKLIQTSAPISHGSSGGGLFDSVGKLVGITTATLSEGQNLNFAVPADWALRSRTTTAVNSGNDDAISSNDTTRKRLKREADDASADGDYETAEARWGELAKLEPTEPFWHISKSYAFYMQHHFEEAAMEARIAIGLAPDSASAHESLASALQRAGNLDGAISEFRNAIRLNPSSGSGHYDLGRALAEAGKLDDAISEYREALRLEPDPYAISPYLRCDLGKLLLKKQDVDASITQLQEAVRLYPGLGDAHYDLAFALYTKRNLNDAIVEFRQAANLKPQSPSYHYFYGVALAADGDREGSKSQFREAIRLKRDFAEAHYELAKMLTGDDSVAEFREALRIKPDYAEARLGLGDALKWECIRRDTHDYGDYWTKFGKRLGFEGKSNICADAIAELRKAIALQPRWAEAHYSLAFMFEWRGDNQEALQDAGVACSLAPNNKEFCDKYKKLERGKKR